MNDDRSWFWNQGYADAIDGKMADVPIEAQSQRQRDDYFAGLEAGREDSLLVDILSGGLEVPDKMLDEEEDMDKKADRFLTLLRQGGATAVPKGETEATAWAGEGIRLIQYAEREHVGNALLAAGVLYFGTAVFGSNSVRIEIRE